MIYVDLMMGINFLVDYLLLLAAQRLTGYPPTHRRLLCAAAVGAAYSGLCCALPFLWGLHWRVVCLAGMCALAFGVSKSACKRAACFVLLSMALGGLSLLLGQGSAPPLLLGGVGLAIICAAAFGGQIGGRKLLPLEIEAPGGRVRVTALADSGNALCDPVTGERALVVGAHEAACLTGLTARELAAPLDTLQRHPREGLHLIPCRTVSGSGFLLAKRFQTVRLGTRTGSALVAFAPQTIGDGTYQALAGV